MPSCVSPAPSREAVNVLFDNHAREDWVIGGAPEFAKSTGSG